MRLFLLVLGIALGVAGTLAYGVFIGTEPAPTARPVASHAPVTASVNETLLTAIVQRIAVGAPGVNGVDVQRTRVRAEIVNDTIVVHAAVKLFEQTTNGTVTLRPVLGSGGTLRIDVVNTNLGTIQLPGVDAAIATQINERLHALLKDLPVVVTGVSVDPVRGLTVTGQVNLQELENAALSAR